MHLVFMGSPALAVPCLEALLEAGHEVTLVVTQLTRRAGRGLRETPTAVTATAMQRGLSLYQPQTLRSEQARARIAAARPDAIVVVAYGRILPPEILRIPTLGCLNVHLSLLPRHRGASPISGALLAGDGTTGVSLMLMEPTLDTGPVLAQLETPIDPSDDQISLTDRLSQLGARLLVETLPAWQAGASRPIPQDEALATWTRPTTRDDARLDWELPALALWRLVRAYAQWPQSFAWWAGKQLRILKADYDETAALPPGRVEAWGPTRRPTAVAIGTGKGVLIPRILGLEGRRALPVDAFLRGYSSLVGTQLSEE